MSASAPRQILEDVQSSDLGRQLAALDLFFSLPASEIGAAYRREVLLATVSSLQGSIDRYLIVERMLRFGDEVIPPLLELVEHSSSSEAKALAALILLNKGSRIGVPVLLREIEAGSDYRNIASIALANVGIIEHVPTLLNQLRKYSPTSSGEFPTTEDDEVLTLLEILKQLQVGLPEDIKRKFSDPSVPHFFRTAIGAGFSR